MQENYFLKKKKNNSNKLQILLLNTNNNNNPIYIIMTNIPTQKLYIYHKTENYIFSMHY